MAQFEQQNMNLMLSLLNNKPQTTNDKHYDLVALLNVKRLVKFVLQ